MMYNSTETAVSAKNAIRSLTKPSRKRASEAKTLLAVAAASPGTMRVDRTYPSLNPAQRMMTRYRSPATLA